MRYIASSRYTLDEIAEQCRLAVLRVQGNNNCQTVDYTEVRKFFRYDNALLVAQ
jgi:hypothetical protein